MKGLFIFLLFGVLAHYAYSIFIFAPVIINPNPNSNNNNNKYPDLGNSYPIDSDYERPTVLPWPTDFLGQELVLHQTPNCSPTKSRFKIPLTGGCQKIPSWMYDDGWEIGASTSSRRIGVRFYADSSCEDPIPDPRAYYLRRSRLELDDLNLCRNLDIFNFRVRSFRPIRYY